MRLRIDDLHAQLAPLDRYGVGGLSSVIAACVWALVRGFGNTLRGGLCCGGGQDCEAV
jgi:hypothetical protein